MKILLVMNKTNRELPIMESIQRAVFAVDPSAEVIIREMCAPGFHGFVLGYRPDVILTFPFTCIGFSTWYYLYKVLFSAKIICFRAEGIVNDGAQETIDFITGFDRYGRNLVDRELFWGSKSAELIGDNLLRKNKVSSKERIAVVGYPRLEFYFEDPYRAGTVDLPERIRNRLNDIDKKNVVLFATGFHLANYTRDDLFAAKDLDAEHRINGLLQDVEKAKRLRASWVRNILRTAQENPTYLFILKKHPIERKGDYVELANIPNIVYVHEDIEMHHLVKHAGLFFHYGSTAVVDSYLSRIPAIYVAPDEQCIWYSDMGWPSAEQVQVSGIPAVVKKYCNGGIIYHHTAEIKKVLRENFNIDEGLRYAPSKEIARQLLDGASVQRLSLTDRYLWKSLLHISIHGFRPWLARVIKKILRMDPNTRLFKGKCSESVCDRKNSNQSI